GVVFQDLALFPWLTVAENIGFGLRRRHIAESQVESSVCEFVEMLRLDGFASAFPSQLSGGMQQRVAIARVLANKPAVLLMDEPFGALDCLTRETMQQELHRICTRLGMTVVFVTHSVEEALYLGDRILVMSGGPSNGEPGHARITVPVTLARPRDVTSPE